MACIKQMMAKDIPVKYRDALKYYGKSEIVVKQYDHVTHGLGLFALLKDHKIKTMALNNRSGKMVSVNEEFYK